jgi:hypothetical protein
MIVFNRFIVGIVSRNAKPESGTSASGQLEENHFEKGNWIGIMLPCCRKPLMNCSIETLQSSKER